MRSPLLTAIGASVGSMFTLGAATLAVSSVGLAVVKQVVKQRKLKAASPCKVCEGTGYVRCSVCAGRAVLRCRAPVKLSLLKKKQAAVAAAAGGTPAPTTQCACPACGTTLQQRCLNCLGEGRVCLPA